MQFAFSEDQHWLKSSARRFCEENAVLGQLRPNIPAAYSLSIWEQMSQELGWTGLIVPETYGGAGLGFVELAALQEEMGRYLLPSPFFSTVCLGTNALLTAANEEQKATYLPRIAAGELRVAVAYVDGDSPHSTDSPVTMKALREGEHYSLTGKKRYVLDGLTAQLLIVAAKASDTERIEFFVVPEDASGVTRTQRATMDPTRCLADLEFESVKVPVSQKLDGSKHPDQVFQAVIDSAAVALAAEQVGGAERCLEMAVAYAKERHQFGQPIGAFQAIKHKCADMLLQLESARSAAYYAAWAASHAPDELSSMAALSKVYCSEAYFECAAENIQIHGGIGFTWEHEAHFYFKRAQSDELFLGTPAMHRERIAQELGL